MPSLPVKPQFGPTLPELAGPGWRRAPVWARALAVLLAALVLAGLATLALGRAEDEERIVLADPVALNLRHGPALTRVRQPPAGERMHLEQRRDGGVVASFAVRPLRLPAYRGSPAGVFPAYAERVIGELGRRLQDFELADEGRVRINEVPGYAVGFRARRGGRRVWGRTVLLVPETEPPRPLRDGARLDLLSAPGSGVSNPADVGAVGQLKLPLRSFRFGTEGP